MGTHDSVWTRKARPIFTERDYEAVRTVLGALEGDEARSDALLREVADYENRATGFSVAAAWAEWVFVPRFEPDNEPRRRWSDARLGFFGNYAIR
jgi:hypothetical protein